METRNAQIIRITAIVLLVIGCLVVLIPFLTGILSAAILCFSTWPVYTFLERRMGGHRTLAALSMTLLVVVVLVLPLALIAAAYADTIPDVVDSVRELIELGLPFPPTWVASIPLVGEWLDANWREIAGSKAQPVDALKRWTVPAREGLVRSGIIIGEGVLQLTLIAFVGFFFLSRREAPRSGTADRSQPGRWEVGRRAARHCRRHDQRRCLRHHRHRHCAGARSAYR